MSVAQTLISKPNNKGLTPDQMGGDHFANATIKAIENSIAQSLQNPSIDKMLSKDVIEGLSWVTRALENNSDNDPTKPFGRKPSGRGL